MIVKKTILILAILLIYEIGALKGQKKYKTNYGHFQNSNLKINWEKKTLDKTILKDSLSIYFQNIEEKPFKLKECIYINPNEKYIYNQENINAPLNEFFILNKPIFDPNNINSCRINFYNPILPNTYRNYVDPLKVSFKRKELLLIVDTTNYISEEIYLTPFYFSKYEITNAEYREFTNYVIDSVAKQILYDDWTEKFISETNSQENKIFDIEKPLDWEDEDVRDILYDTIYINKENKFYYGIGYNIELMNYEYEVLTNDSIYQKILNIYPDTNCWITESFYGHALPVQKDYFWHPAFDDYPVVGVNYYQALAFLNWKTESLKKDLNKKGIQVKVKFDLPSEAEWDMVATSEKKDKKINIFTSNYYFLSDDSWITDLSLIKNTIEHFDSTASNTYPTHLRKTYRKDALHKSIKKGYLFKDQKSDNDYQPFPIKINKKKDENPILLGNIDDFGICHMGSNVSEWLKESYKENWEPVFCKRQELLRTFEDEDIKILASIEAYYDRKNHPEGRLVKGANWYDHRFSNLLGKNIEGINAKVFADPNRGYSTVGFRYVIRVYPK